MELSTVLGLIIAFVGMLGGNHLEGGSIGSLIQGPAAVIVLGGTFGAVMVAYPMADLIKAVKAIKLTFVKQKDDNEKVIEDIVAMARIARKDGLLALERNLEEVQDPFMKKYLQQIIDGIEPEMLKDQMETEIDLAEEELKTCGKVLEAGGGFAPTIGIIGAVLGLILVMQNLSDPSKLGGGIAVAFVATVYGLIVANVFCLPMGTKLKRLAETQMISFMVIMDGLLALQAGHNPKVIEDKLRIYLHDKKPKETEK